MPKDTENIQEKDAQGICNPMALSMRVSIPDAVFERVLRETLLKRLFTVNEAAVYLGKGTDSIRQMIYSKTIPVIQKGDRGKVYLDRFDLDQWIQRNKGFSGEVKE